MANMKFRAVAFTVAVAVLDALWISLAFVCAVTLSVPEGEPLANYALGHLPYLIIFIGVWWVTAMDDRLWGSRRSEELPSYLSCVTKAVGDALVFSVFVMALFDSSGLDRDLLVAFALGTLLLMLLFRGLMRIVLSELRRRRYNLRRILVVGANDRCEALVRTIRSHPEYGYEVVGFVEDEPQRRERFERWGVRFLGETADFERILREWAIEEVFICLPVRSFYVSIQSIAEHCERLGIPVCINADLFPVRVATSRLMHVEDIPFLSLSAIPDAPLKLAMKRAFDLLVSTVLLVLLSPLFFLLALIIKLDSKGPVFFLQERVGQNQRRFQMIKFRSMVADAEQLRKALEAQNEADGPVFKIRHDPRITRVGRFIRKYSIDEFPQLINVWLGEMSLVGPRPPLASEVEQYSWDQRRRLSVKPGMTGLWQVSGRSDVTFDEWVEMDLKYIDNWSLAQDFAILLKTFRAVWSGRGAA